mmetsp:Transcript_13297/g.22752  ORF Transcript_13297/g.22752 Transcript_13297/m.22752 type:complete len:236 (-) Transcript_13297:1572-2279(-)
MKVFLLFVGEERRVQLEIKDENPKVQDVFNSMFHHKDLMDVDPKTHKIRLIYGGKLLSDPAATLQSFNIAPDSVIHCQYNLIQDNAPHCESPQAQDPQAQEALSRSQQTSIAHYARPSSGTEHEFSSQADTDSHYIELDEEELANLRLQYVLELMEQEEEEERGLLFFDDLDGAWSDFVWGFLLGFFLGMIMLIVSWDRSIRLSRKWRTGIMFGVTTNMVVGVFMLWSDRRHRRI